MTRVQIENAPNYDAGLLKMAPGGALVQSLTNTVARTDTSAKTLFTLPAGATILFWTVHAPAVSDAATTALLVVGKSGDADFFLDDINLKVVTGFMVPNNNAAEGGGGRRLLDRRRRHGRRGRDRHLHRDRHGQHGRWPLDRHVLLHRRRLSRRPVMPIRPTPPKKKGNPPGKPNPGKSNPDKPNPRKPRPPGRPY